MHTFNGVHHMHSHLMCTSNPCEASLVYVVGVNMYVAGVNMSNLVPLYIRTVTLNQNPRFVHTTPTVSM